MMKNFKIINNPLVDKLKSIDLEKVDPKGIEALFNGIISLGFISNIIPKGEQVCRMRIIDIEKENIPIFSHELSYNPKPSNEYGRCHLLNESVFYGSLNTEIIRDYMNIFFEVTNNINRKNNKIRFVASSWIVQEDITVIDVGSYLKHLPKVSELRKEFITNQTNLNFISKLWSIQLDDFLANEFSREINANYEYKITASFSSYIFNLGVAGLIYPSVQTNGAGLNIALDRKIIDQKLLVPKHAIFGVQYYRDLKSKDEILMNGNINDNGIILWKDYPEGHMDETSKKYFTGQSDYYPSDENINFKNLD